MRLPFNGTYPLTQDFGVDLGFKYGIHQGKDYGLPQNIPLVAPMAGKVVWAGWAGDAGNAVTIANGNLNAKTFHMNRVDVAWGQQVTEGQPIGLSGNTGYSTGPHVHFQVELNGTPVNPANYVNNKPQEVNMPSIIDIHVTRILAYNILGYDGMGITDKNGGGRRPNAIRGEVDNLIKKYWEEKWEISKVIWDMYNSKRAGDFNSMEIPQVYDMAQKYKDGKTPALDRLDQAVNLLNQLREESK